MIRVLDNTQEEETEQGEEEGRIKWEVEDLVTSL